MEDVILAIVPVRESCMVRASLLHWLCRSNDLNVFSWGRFTLLAAVPLLMSCLQVHGVRVDDFCLFFHVKSLFVIPNICLRQLVGVILSII